MNTDIPPLQETPLADEHRSLGARMVPFAGWNMPVQYDKGILAEHAWTRSNVSVFDICHMGEFRVKGADAANALDNALARSVIDQPVGVCRYNFLLEENGGVLDDLIVYRISPEEFYIVVNAGTRPNDAAVLQERLGSAVSFTDESDGTAKLDVQGPRTAELLADFGFPASSLPGYYKFIQTEFEGITCILSRTGYTGELGVELYFPAVNAVEMWRKLLNHPLAAPAGLGARDTLRLEMGYALYGHELNNDTTPLEANAGRLFKLENTHRDFIGSAALRTQAPRKTLIGLLMEGRRAARAGDVVLCNGMEIGKVTSGAFGPSVGAAVAMAYIDPAYSKMEDFEIKQIRGTIKAMRAAMPFYTGGTARKKN